MADGHPIGPGPHPDLRDEPVAFAIWQSLLGVRNAWGWADVARQVEADLRRRGLVGDVHERLRAAEAEVSTLAATNSSLRAQWQASRVREGLTARGCMERVKGHCSTHDAPWSGSELTGCDAVAVRHG